MPKSSSRKFDFWFDKEAAGRAVQFFEQFLAHVKGEWSGQPLSLEKWHRVRQLNTILNATFAWGTCENEFT